MASLPPPDEPIPLPEVPPELLEEVLPVPPAPRPPGPHLGWALLWALLFTLLSQIVVGIPLALLVLALAVVQHGMPGPKDDFEQFLKDALVTPWGASIFCWAASWATC